MFLVAAGVTMLGSGCNNPGERARLVKDNENLRRRSEELERTIAQRDATVARLHQQIRNLQEFSPDRPADLFAPVKIEIISRSGGADYDNRPGDDGVTVYLQPIDADGDAVKVPGQITVQLLDNTNLEAPRVVKVYRFSDPSDLRRLWFGKLGTNHYSLKCPFPPGAHIPRQITVNVEFVDYLTGRTLTAVREVTVAPGEET
ncbi:MAG: hypothetical protein KJ749_14465 [Planctomycetes bacterium]|nr:hypothetical protein [Planctomycetota bacterium]